MPDTVRRLESMGVLWTGTFRISISGPNRLRTMSVLNLITDAGLNYMRGLLTGVDAPPTAIRYIGLGSSATPPANGDTQLGAEFFRKAVSKQETPATGQVETTCYVAPYEANGQIEEIGIFAGPDATAAPNTGVLIARVLWSHFKTELESLQIERTDTITRVA